MDGVLVHEENAIPGADTFIARLRERGLPFLVLTNNSMYTQRDLSARLSRTGLEVPEEAIWTSALATARFLEDQRPGGSAFVIGEAGLPLPAVANRRLDRRSRRGARPRRRALSLGAV
jgi:NagD protein